MGQAEIMSKTMTMSLKLEHEIVLYIYIGLLRGVMAEGLQYVYVLNSAIVLIATAVNIPHFYIYPLKPKQ